MAQCSSDQVLGFLATELRRNGLRVEKLVLFGSQAKGTAREDSDIGVAVVSPDFRDKDVFDRVDMTAKAGSDTIMKFIVPLDLVMLTPEEYESRSSAIASFAREGEEIRM